MRGLVEKEDDKVYWAENIICPLRLRLHKRMKKRKRNEEAEERGRGQTQANVKSAFLGRPQPAHSEFASSQFILSAKTLLVLIRHMLLTFWQ